MTHVRDIDERKGGDVHKLLLTVEETAQVLAIGRTKVFDLIALGLLKSVRIGGSRRVPVTAVEEFVARLCSSQAR